MRQVLFVIAIMLRAQSIKPDTQALAATLKAIRPQKDGLTLNQFRAIHKAFLQWVDVRLRNREGVDRLNRELRAAGIFDTRAERDFKHNPFPNYAGFLSAVTVSPIEGAGDLLAVRLGIGTMCSADQTMILYQRHPWRRIGWLSHGDLERGVGWGFWSFKVGERDANGTRMVVSAEYSEWCSSSFIGVRPRIDVLDGTSLKTLLDQDEGARLDSGEPITASVDGNVVAFRYLPSAMWNQGWTQAIERYSVDSKGATRIAPLATNRIGFIDEWLRMDDAEAARWSTAEAAQMHRSILKSLPEYALGFGFEKITLCHGAWEVTLGRVEYPPKSTGKWFILLSDSDASNMRILGVGKDPHTGCVEKDLKALTEELPQ